MQEGLPQALGFWSPSLAFRWQPASFQTLHSRSVACERRPEGRQPGLALLFLPDGHRSSTKGASKEDSGLTQRPQVGPVLSVLRSCAGLVWLVLGTKKFRGATQRQATANNLGTSLWKVVCEPESTNLGR
uniref:Uncharacterized protein n=1 Tax=Sphaerodactylus townsendi TaxID=933632 RepID=A0ACB8FMF0_9SAUR